MSLIGMDSQTGALLAQYLKPLSDLVNDPDVTDIFVNGHDTIFYKKTGQHGVLKHTESFQTNEDLKNAVIVLANTLSQELTETSPLLDARLPDGSRVNVVFPPVAEHVILTLRLFPQTPYDSAALISNGTIPQESFEFLTNAVQEKKNIVVSGGTGSGKTTLIQTLINEIPHDRRIVLIEDTKELKLTCPNYVQLEAANRLLRHGTQNVTIGDLVINALRQTPDHLIVGEIRDSLAASAFKTAINTGHDGCITSIHANSARDVIRRLTTLTSQHLVSISTDTLGQEFMNDVDVIVQCNNTGNGRRVTEIVECSESGIAEIYSINEGDA